MPEVVSVRIEEHGALDPSRFAHPDARTAAAYIRLLADDGLAASISNARGTMLAIVIDDAIVLPLFVPDARAAENTAYTSSMYAHYISYARAELRELRSPILQRLAAVALLPLAAMLRAARIDDAVYINNWLLSTNLYPALEPDAVEAVTTAVNARFRGRHIVWNSINEHTTGALHARMRDLGYTPLFSRSIWVQDEYEGLGSRVEHVLRRERRLAATSEYRFRDSGSDDDVDEPVRAADLYRRLYVEKYSPHNPQLTARFMARTRAAGIVEYEVLARDGEDAAGVIGHIAVNGILTTPVLGYDLDRPRDDGLYRILSIRLQDKARDLGLVFHSSAGAGEFKKSRGARNHIEYRMIALDGVPRWRAALVRGFAALAERVVVPMMMRRGL
ncbi:GNAT family N-acetyltransferase [Microbacterium sp. NPDC089695]|uniref:GNAT family N-acetyltransferase n=1 Tax=Microbacterium sp. NPDC089695 TaxID=3364198 RepID=UPI0037FA7E8C